MNTTYSHRRRLPLVFLALALCVACATAPGADPVVVRAEQTWRIGFDAVDAFVVLERQGTVPGLKSSAAAHAFAEKLRAPNPEGARFPPSGGPPGSGGRAGQVKPYGRWVFDKLDDAIVSYKANRTTEGKANLQTYLALAESLISTASGYLKGGGL